MTWATRAAWAAALGLLVAGCGDSEEEAPSAASASFEGIPWVVSAGLDAPGAQAHAPSATFADGKLSGSTGCNQYTTSYTQTGDRIELAPVASTQMACDGPAGAVEREFLDTLTRVERWNAGADALVLADKDGNALLRFRAASPEGAWVATMVRTPSAVSSVILGTEITATFAPDGELTGSGGCNRYRTRYTTDGATIAIEPPAATKKACTDLEGAMEQEQAYLAALPRAARYAVEGPRLTLLAADGTIVATYERAP